MTVCPEKSMALGNFMTTIFGWFFPCFSQFVTGMKFHIYIYCQISLKIFGVTSTLTFNMLKFEISRKSMLKMAMLPKTSEPVLV